MKYSQTIILKNKRHLIHQHTRISLSDINTADLHCAGADIPESRNQAGRRGLTASGWPDQCNSLSGLRTEGNVFQRRNLRAVIGKAHVPEFHTIVLRSLRVFCNLKYRRIHYLRDTPQRRVGQHHPACRKHDPRQCCGYDGREHRVKGEVRHKACKIPGFQRSRSQKQRNRHKEDKRAFRKGQIDGLRQTTDFTCIQFCFGTIIFYSCLEGSE